MTNKTQANLTAARSADIPDNTAQEITAADMRAASGYTLENIFRGNAVALEDDTGRILLEQGGYLLLETTDITEITDPTDIADCVLWLDGSDSSTMLLNAGTQPWGVGSGGTPSDGNTIAHWADKSGNDYHLNQSGGNNEPTYKTGIQNGLSIVRGIDAAVDDYLYSTSSVLSQDQAVTIFYVAALTSDETEGTVFSNTNTSNNRIVVSADSRAATNRVGYLVDSSGTATFPVDSDVGTGFNQGTAVISSSTLTGRINGVAGTSQSKAGDGVTANDYTRIFNMRGPSTYLFGDIAEVVVYDAELSMPDILGVEKYLKDKWATP